MSTSVAPPLGVNLGSRLSFMMFLQFAVWGAWLPILYPFLLGHRGFTLEETGLCLSAGAVGAIFGPFIAGQLADRTISTEKLLGISHLIGAVLVYMLGEADTFGGFMVLSALYGFVYAPTIALTNSLAFHHMPDRDRDFGLVRLWGTVGWIVAGIVVGQYLLRFATPAEGTLEQIEAAQNAGRSFAFTLSAGLGVLMGIYCFFLPHTPPSKSQDQKLAWAEALSEIKMQPLLTLFLIAVPVSMVHQFYFVFTSQFVTEIQNAAASDAANSFANAVNEILGVGGGGLMTIGQMSEIAVLACIPVMAGRLSKKALLCIGLAAYAVRMALFAFMPDLVPVMLGVALHGVCFGCFIFVAFLVVDEHTSKDVRATAQNLFNLVIVGIGIIVGSWFATAVVGKWANNIPVMENGVQVIDADGIAVNTMNWVDLFSVPMWIAVACLAVMLVAYPSRPVLKH